MKRIALLGVLLALLVSGCAQKPPESYYPYPESLYDLYKPLVVQIQTKFVKGKPEHGFGFIVGEDEAAKQFYIVTANHVVRNEDPDDSGAQISVRLSWDSGAPRMATLLDNYSSKNELDLALLRLDKKVSDQNPWKGQTWCRDWQKRQSVWFIGWEDKFQFPPEPGILLERTPAPARIKIWMETIKPGNSGTPLIIEDGGIVGMAVKDNSIENKVVAVDIEDIYNFVREQSSYPWKINKGDCTGFGSGRVTIVWTESTFETAQKIKTALTDAGFTAGLKEFSALAPIVRSNLPDKHDRPGIKGNNLFFFSAGGQTASVRQIGSIIQQELKNSQLIYRPVPEERIARGLTIGSGEMLLVLNESRSFWGKLFDWSSN